jgi:F0F1-type ATP synthase assembly protein I
MQIMSFLNEVNDQNLNFNQPVQTGSTRAVLIKIGLIVTGILFICVAVVAYYLGVNAIVSYVTGGVGGILIISTCLVSCIQWLKRKMKDVISETAPLTHTLADKDTESVSPSSPKVQGTELLDVELNFPTEAGSHTILSPIVGTRYHELQAVKDKMRQCPILRALEKAIYQSPMIYLIPLDKKDEADAISKPLFLEYISKYSSEGITENNIVRWLDEESMSKSPISNKTSIYDGVNRWNTWRVKIYVMSRRGKANEGYDRYLPPYVVAYHEVMHAEETPKQAKVSYETEAGGELLTTIKTFILLDLVYKRIYNIPEHQTVDYGKNILLRGKSIPLGEFASFYHNLEQKHGALYKALISPESISYLS